MPRYTFAVAIIYEAEIIMNGDEAFKADQIMIELRDKYGYDNVKLMHLPVKLKDMGGRNEIELIINLPNQSNR